MRKIRIAVVMQSPDRGGAETFMTSLIKELSSENDIFTASDSNEFLSRISKNSKTKKINLTMDIIGNRRGFIKTFVLLPYALIVYFNALSWLRKEKVDVILMSNFTEKLFVTLLSPLFSIPVVWIEYGNLNNVLKRNFGIPKLIYRLAGRIPSFVIVPTDFTKGSLIKDARMSLSKIRTIALGVETPRSYSPNTNKKVFMIGSVSRLTKEKGQELLIKAMPEILKTTPKAKLLIVGQGPDGNYFKNLTKELKLEQFIEFTGFAKDLDKEYSRMNIFVFPTVWDMEGFGLVIPEAMLRRIPVLASDMEPVTAIIQNEKTGFLFRPGDPSEIAKAVIRLYEDPKLALRLSNNAYEYALKNYTIKKSSTKVKNILYEATIR